MAVTPPPPPQEKIPTPSCFVIQQLIKFCMSKFLILILKSECEFSPELCHVFRLNSIFLLFCNSGCVPKTVIYKVWSDFASPARCSFKLGLNVIRKEEHNRKRSFEASASVRQL